MATGVLAMAFCCEYTDSTLGMGYGTMLTPLLMLAFGFEPLQIVPAVLLSELVTGLLAGFTHHSVGNVDLRPKTLRVGRIIRNLRRNGVRDSVTRGLPVHLRIALLIGCCSVVGSVASVLIATSVPQRYVKAYIGVLILCIGLGILLLPSARRAFTWRRVVFLGLLASFNKGMSGGGYGPVVTGGQLLAGVDGRSAVGITSLAEGLTCAVGVAVYLVRGGQLSWSLAPLLVLGGVLSVPLAALTVRAVDPEHMRRWIGAVTALLGALALGTVLS
jgi:uncharacterized membrane protein YfcA